MPTKSYSPFSHSVDCIANSPKKLEWLILISTYWYCQQKEQWLVKCLNGRITTISYNAELGPSVSSTLWVLMWALPSPLHIIQGSGNIFPFSLSSSGVFHDGQSHISGIWNKSLPGGLGQREFPTKTATLPPGACELHTSRSPHPHPWNTEEPMQVWPSHQPWGPRFSKAQLFPSGPIEFTELS